MAETSASDPAGEAKVGGKKKGGLLTGKNKWYVVGGLGILAVLVFFFVSRSKSNATGTTTTSGTSLDPATQAALQGALQAQGSGIGTIGATGDTGPTGPAGATGATGKPGKRGKQGEPGKSPKPRTPVTHRGGNSSFYTVRPGDSLSSIASRYGIKGGWTALYHSNRSVVGSNPNAIQPGQRLKV